MAKLFFDFKAVLHAFISTRLDYFHALYVGVKKAELCRLLAIQNAATRLLIKSQRCEHITPILASLQWLNGTF